MCTAITYHTKDHYFGRTLDYERSFGERVAVTPRNYPFVFRKAGTMNRHYAMIGMAAVVEGYPLYYEATNEKGLSMAGLNFPGNAVYFPEMSHVDNVAPFEFIPWILGQCSSVAEARDMISRMNFLNENFSGNLPLSPLHWIIADRYEAITVESVKDGINVYENPAGALTNNPTFDRHLWNLEHRKEEVPGDWDSESRLLRAVHVRDCSVSGASEAESVSQFFHILGTVSQPRGVNPAGEEQYKVTIYTSCCSTEKGIYYYTTYENSRITGVDMHGEDLNGHEVVSYELLTEPDIKYVNTCRR